MHANELLAAKQSNAAFIVVGALDVVNVVPFDVVVVVAVVVAVVVSVVSVVCHRLVVEYLSFEFEITAVVYLFFSLRRTFDIA